MMCSTWANRSGHDCSHHHQRAAHSYFPSHRSSRGWFVADEFYYLRSGSDDFQRAAGEEIWRGVGEDNGGGGAADEVFVGFAVKLKTAMPLPAEQGADWHQG